jgi:uncharacterized membrane protein
MVPAEDLEAIEVGVYDFVVLPCFIAVTCLVLPCLVLPCLLLCCLAVLLALFDIVLPFVHSPLLLLRSQHGLLLRSHF